MIKLLLINDTYDQENWGAQLGAYALKQIYPILKAAQK